MERKEETSFDGTADARRSCANAVATQCAENSLSANVSSNDRVSERTCSKLVSASGSDDDNSPPARDHGCTRQTERVSRTSSSSCSQDEDELNGDDSSFNSGKTKKKKPKLDRSKLRKGKWTVSPARSEGIYLSLDSHSLTLAPMVP